MSVLLLFNSCRNISMDTCEAFNKLQSSPGRFVDTIKLLSMATEVIKNDSNCIEALLTRADIFSSLNKIDSAKLAYLKVYLFYPSNVYTLYQLGMLYEGLGSNDSAAYYFKLALLNKVRDSAFIDYSSNLKKLSDKDAKYDIPTIELIYQSGVCYYYLREMKLAEKNFDLCIVSNYMVGQSYIYRGSINFEMNNKVEACEDFKKALENGNEDANDYINKYCK